VQWTEAPSGKTMRGTDNSSDSGFRRSGKSYTLMSRGTQDRRCIVPRWAHRASPTDQR